MSWADAIQNNLLWVQGIMLGVQILALFGLFLYVMDTKGLRKAAEGQIAVSQDLLRAANAQAEGVAKPCMTIRAKLRDAGQTLVHGNRAVGGSVVNDEAGFYVAINVGSGSALNVSYFFKARRDSDKPWDKKAASYFQTISPNQQVQLALLINAYPGENEITFLFQSLGGRWYESVVTIESKVLTDFGFKQLPESFHPNPSYSP
jgi:hypothetical protein